MEHQLCARQAFRLYQEKSRLMQAKLFRLFLWSGDAVAALLTTDWRIKAELRFWICVC
jgi:hypothetical protein